MPSRNPTRLLALLARTALAIAVGGCIDADVPTQPPAEDGSAPPTAAARDAPPSVAAHDSALPVATPRAEPNADARAARPSADALARRVAERTMQLDFDRWDWDSGVAMVGLMTACRATGERSYCDFVGRWVDEFIDAGLPPITHPNHAAPGPALLMLYEVTGQRKYLDAAQRVAEPLLVQAPRSRDGALFHYEDQLWVDTLFMTVPFLARLGRVTGDPRYVEEAVNQYLQHARHLQDERTGLFFHGWDESADDHVSGAFWERGNGWAIATAAELLDLLPAEHAARPKIRDAFARQAAGLAPLQDRSGLWHTVVDRTGFYLETSGAAAIGYALFRGMNQGALDEEAVGDMAVRAWEGVAAKVDRDGTVLDVSAGTGVGKDIEAYNKVSHDTIQPYGQGLALLMLVTGSVDTGERRDLPSPVAPTLYPNRPLADRIWEAAERLSETYPPSTMFPGYVADAGGPSAGNARRNVDAACHDFPDFPDYFGPGAHHRACYEWTAADLALFHAARALRLGRGPDVAWAQAYLDVALDELTAFVYGPEDLGGGASYRDSLAGIWQNPLRAVSIVLAADLLRELDALGTERQVRAEELLSGIARAWYAEFWQTAIHPTTGAQLTTRTALDQPAYSLAGKQVTASKPWTFSWDADKGNSPAEETAWLGAGAMLASRALADRLSDAGDIYAAGRHYVDYALTYDRPDPVHGGEVRTLNGETTGGAYGQRRYWLENHGADTPAIPYVAATWHFLDTALFASDLGDQEPWPSLVPGDRQWTVMLRSAGETLRAADGTVLVDFTPGGGIGFNMDRFPEWWTPCGQARAGRQYVRYDGRSGGAPLYVSEIGHAAGLDMIATGWPIMRIAAARNDQAAYATWQDRLHRVLDEHIARPPNPAWAECKTAAYVSSNPGYHWTRMMGSYVIAALGASGYELGVWEK